MALLPILRYPDPRLYQKAAPVGEITQEIRDLVRDLAETMYSAPGIGLAATQVNVHKQVIVVDTSDARDTLLVLINPEILAMEGVQYREEGCLSVPGVYESVERAEWVHVRAMGLDGRQFEFDSEQLQAVCIQHEMDHLQGKVFVDYLSRLKRSRIRSKMQKQQRMSA